MFALPRLLPVLTLLLAATLTGCGDQSDARQASAPLRLLDLEGREVDPLAESGARVTVLLFARTDCPISNRYAPEIQRLYAAFAPRDVAFFLVYPDPGQTPQAIRKHLEAYDYAFGGLRDPQHAVVELTGATITPEAAVFGPSGTMVYRGRIDDRYVTLGKVRAAPTTHDLEDAIEAALEGRPIDNPTTKAIGCIIADLK